MSSTHHFYYRDIKQAAVQANVDLTELKAVEQQERALRLQAGDLQARRRAICAEMITAKGEQLKPFLRPCHQRELGKGSLRVYIDSWDTTY